MPPTQLNMPVRAAKGVAMFFMYVLFGAFIAAGVFFIHPFFWVQDRLRGPDPNRMQCVVRWFFAFWLSLLRLGGLLHAPRIEGEIPPGPHVVVANHPGLFDVLVLIRDIPNMSVLAKRQLVRTLPIGHIMKTLGYVVAPAEAGFGALATVNRCVERLESGFSFMAFPEGTRSPKGKMRRFRPGPFVIAARAGVPVLPVVIENDPPFLPKEDRWYYPPRPLSVARARALPPMPPPEPGSEKEFAARLEAAFRKELGLEPKAVKTRDAAATA